VASGEREVGPGVGGAGERPASAGAARPGLAGPKRAGAGRSRPGPSRGVFFVGMISAFEELFETAASKVSASFGPVSCASETFAFDFTDYYNAEMGDGLLRKYYAFGPFEEDELARAKKVTASIERELLYPGTARRRVNLDPGSLTAAHLVLASHKRAAHRVLLGDGVYAELELVYESGEYRPLPWTYPDYRSDEARRFLAAVRRDLVRAAQAASGGASPGS